MTYEVKSDENNIPSQQTPTQQQQSTTSEQTATTLGTDWGKERDDCIKEWLDFTNDNNFEQAKMMFQRALVIDPNSMAARYSLATVNAQLWDYANALELINQVIQIEPKNASAHFNKGNFLYNIKDYTGAVAEYEQAKQLEFLYVEAMHNLWLALKKLGKDDEAEAQVTNAAHWKGMIEAYWKPMLYSRFKTWQDLHNKTTD